MLISNTSQFSTDMRNVSLFWNEHDIPALLQEKMRQEIDEYQGESIRYGLIDPHVIPSPLYADLCWNAFGRRACIRVFSVGRSVYRTSVYDEEWEPWRQLWSYDTISNVPMLMKWLSYQAHDLPHEGRIKELNKIRETSTNTIIDYNDPLTLNKGYICLIMFPWAFVILSLIFVTIFMR